MIKITIPVNNTNTEYIPTSHSFVENEQLLNTLSYAINEDLPVLLIGDTGTGKTSAIRYLANQTKNAFRRLNLNGQTSVDEFVGKILVNEKGTYWVDGILPDAMRKGHWLLLDEINSALPEVLFTLQSLLDDDKFIVLSDKPEAQDKKGDIISVGNEIVRPHPNFRLFATMNPSDNYVGTKELNKALMSRFPIVLEVHYPKVEDELAIVKSRFPKVDEAEITNVIDFGNQLRNSYYAHEMDFIFSTRELLNWIKINEYFKDWQKSAEMSFLAKCNEEDKESVKSLLKINFRTDKFRTTELKTGDTIMVHGDIEIFRMSSKIEAKSSCVVREVKAGSKFGDTITLEILSTPKSKSNTSHYASVGEAWSILAKDLEDKFSIKKIK